ncbi:MAG: pilus assembly protein TadB, partial [Sphingomonadales bacterium]|nr:pilus assembly protein TadB [Sphingomonadales bacterium]
MDIFQTLLITTVIFAVLVGGYLLVSGSGVAKVQKRRMQALRYRHSESLDAKVDAQFRRAIAARKPKAYKVKGAGNRMEALTARLDRTGKNWSVSQYVYSSLGLVIGVAVFA